MRKLGKVTAVLLTAGAVGAVILGVRSAPDIKRYLKIRQM